MRYVNLKEILLLDGQYICQNENHISTGVQLERLKVLRNRTGCLPFYHIKNIDR